MEAYISFSPTKAAYEYEYILSGINLKKTENINTIIYAIWSIKLCDSLKYTK